MSATTLYGFIAARVAAHRRSTAARAAVGVVALLWVSLIAFGRVYLGAHYPSDVVAGLAAGGAWLTIVVTGIQVAHRRHAIRRAARDRRG